jgi:NAD(P)H dehydrogenase (quinone)
LPKVLIVYDSRTGNTEKMAQAVAEGAREVKGVKVKVKRVTKATLDDLVGADGIIMGSPTYFGQMSGKLKEFVDESVKVYGKLKGKVGAAFTSAGGTATGAETTLLSILQAMLIHGMVVEGRHSAQHYGAAAVGAPKKKEVESCLDLGRRVAILVVKLKAH